MQISILRMMMFGSPFPLVEFTGRNAVDVDSFDAAITFHEDPEAQEAPFIIMASANITNLVGVRLSSTLDVNEYMDGDFRWLLTYSDDTPIEDLGEIKRITAPLTYVDAFLSRETVGPEFTFPIRKEEDYKLRLSSRYKSSTNEGGYIERVVSVTFSIAKNTQLHTYHSSVDGDNTNDGKDPNGFALDAGVYTEATRRLVQTGKFATYNHTTATSYGYDRDNTNWIYVDGELRRISAKISDDEIEIDSVYALGSDKTGLTSSDGPKGEYATVPSGGNFAIHLKGGESTTLATVHGFRSKSGRLSYEAYGAGVFTFNESPSKELNVFDNQMNPNDSTHSKSMTFSRMAINPDSLQRLYFNFWGENTNPALLAEQHYYFEDRCQHSAFVPYNATSLTIKASNQLTWGNTVNGNNRLITKTLTVESANIGDGFITIQETLPVDFFNERCRAPVRLRIPNNSGVGYTNYIVTSETSTGSTLTLTGGRQVSATLLETIPKDTVLTLHENRSGAYYCTNTSTGRFAFLGNIIEAQADANIYDHFLYPNLKSDHSHFAFNYARDGENVGYFFNTNNDYSPETKYYSVHDNFQDSGEWFIDGSNATNNPLNNVLSNFKIFNNTTTSKVKKGFLYSYCMISAFLKNNVITGSATNENAALSPDNDGRLTTAANAIPTVIDFSAEGNKLYEIALSIDAKSNTELSENTIYSTKSGATLLSIKPSVHTAGSSHQVTGNTIYRPNGAGIGVAFEGYATSTIKLSDFNNSVGGTNRIGLPAWNDPANGDFSEVTVIPTLATFPDVSFTESVEFFRELVEYQTAGTVVDLWEIVGTLPAGITINAASGTLGGTPTATGTTTGLVAKATNDKGEVSSNTFSITVNPAVVLWNSSATNKLIPVCTGFAGENEIRNGGYLKFKFKHNSTMPVVGYISLTLGSSNLIRIYPSSIVIKHTYGTSMTITMDTTSLILNNIEHTLEFPVPAVGAPFTVIVDEVAYNENVGTLATSENRYKVQEMFSAADTGSVRDLEMNNGTLGVQFAMSTINTGTPKEVGSDGTSTLEYVNTVSGDWKVI